MKDDEGWGSNCANLVGPQVTSVVQVATEPERSSRLRCTGLLIRTCWAQCGFVPEMCDMPSVSAPQDLSTFLVGTWWQQLSMAPITFDLVLVVAVNNVQRSGDSR